MKTFLFLFLLTLGFRAAEPTREAGLSIHLLPDRVAKIMGEAGGFSVTDPASGRTAKTYGEPKEMLAYVRHLPPAVRENGIWIVTTDPSSYSEAEQARLQALVTLCAGDKISVYTCRGSELPHGWKRAGK